MLIHTPHGTIVAVMDPQGGDMLIVQTFPVGLIDQLLADAGLQDIVGESRSPVSVIMSRHEFTDLLYAQIMDMTCTAPTAKDPPYGYEEGYLRSLPPEAWLEDGTLDPDYLAALP